MHALSGTGTHDLSNEAAADYALVRTATGILLRVITYLNSLSLLIIFCCVSQFSRSQWSCGLK
jgi:hypothetical protein